MEFKWIVRFKKKYLNDSNRPDEDGSFRTLNEDGAKTLKEKLLSHKEFGDGVLYRQWDYSKDRYTISDVVVEELV
ncbi:hypothetical protein phiOC_p149 [Ochrobactrum phage vB_OspM_OC]|nr:hypothetical protein phiOC_p149 [Ochrobactrum phage vB_OspM_OC]